MYLKAKGRGALTNGSGVGSTAGGTSSSVVFARDATGAAFGARAVLWGFLLSIPNQPTINSAAFRVALVCSGSSASAIPSITRTRSSRLPPPFRNVGLLLQSPKQWKRLLVSETWNWLLFVPL